jgi:hypothetical protein
MPWRALAHAPAPVELEPTSYTPYAAVQLQVFVQKLAYVAKLC